jgi:hypothetical protein
MALKTVTKKGTKVIFEPYHFFQSFSNIQKEHDLLLWGQTLNKSNQLNATFVLVWLQGNTRKIFSIFF